MRKQTGLIFLLFIAFAIYAPAQQWGLYTLYSTQNSNKAYLIDTNNVVYHTWTFANNARTGYTSHLLPDRSILRAVARSGNSFFGGGITGQVQKVAWDGTVEWNFVYSTAQYCAHHDICPMPNGNVLLISYESKTPAEATQAGCTSSMTIWSEKIVEIKPTGPTTGEIVWEWHLWDHLCQNVKPDKDNYVASIIDHPELLNINYATQKDWLHANGIDYNPELDQIVFSSHNLNEFYVIDHSTTTEEAAGHTGGNSGRGGDFLYRWGNPAAYQAQGAKNFNVLHDIHWIKPNCPNAGYFVAFNNNGISNFQSCVDQIAPPYNGYNYSWTPGSAYAPASYALRHNCNGHSYSQSSSQQLPNGNMLVCIAESGLIYELDPAGNTIWSKNAGGIASKAFRYSECYVNGGLTVEVSASEYEICVGEEVQLNAVVTGAANYRCNWSSNPMGFFSNQTNPVVSPSVTTTYIVTALSDDCTATASVTIKVNSIPETPTIEELDGTLVSSSPEGNQWYHEGVKIEGATGQFYLPEEEGWYQVSVTINGCESELSEPYYYVFSGLTLPDEAAGLRIFPNPTNGIVNFDYPDSEFYDATVAVVSSYGKVVEKRKLTPVMDFSNLSSGIYLMKIYTSANRLISRKLSIMK